MNRLILIKEFVMKKLTLLPAIVLGVASFGLSAGAFADAQDPVSQVVTGTHETVKQVGQGTADTVNHVGGTANAAVKGTGDAVGAVGQGTSDTVKAATGTDQ